MKFLRKAKALALLAATALAGTGLAAATAAVAATPKAVGAVTDETTPQRLSIEKKDIDVGPGVHRVWQRPLTGLEIRAVRKQSRAVATNRMDRSRYKPNGVPARITKALLREKALTASKA